MTFKAFIGLNGIPIQEIKYWDKVNNEWVAWTKLGEVKTIDPGKERFAVGPTFWDMRF